MHFDHVQPRLSFTFRKELGGVSRVETCSRAILSVAKPLARAGRNPWAVYLLPPPSLIPPGALRNTLIDIESRTPLRFSVG
jgi:hypothetical protein